MRKIGLLFYAILLVTVHALGQEPGIHFINDQSWQQIKKKAKKEKKYIFIDVYATWCGPCKAMDAQVYPDEAVGRLLNDRFISIKVQQDQSKNDNEQVKSRYADAKAICKQYVVQSLPTFLFFTPDGKLMHRSSGYKSTDGFIQTVHLALTNPMLKLDRLLAEYKDGKRDSAFLVSIVSLAFDEEDRSNALIIAANHIKSMENPFTKGNLEFIQKYTQKSTDPGFNIFFNNIDKVNKVLGANRAEKLIRKVIEKEEIDPYLDKTNKSPDWNSLIYTVKKKYGQIGEEKTYGSQMVYYLENKDWEAFGQAYKRYYQTAISNSEYHINNVSWHIFEHVTDPLVLAIAIEATKYNIENYSKDDPTDMDTYANLLYKTGQRDAAIEIEKKAVKLSNYKKDLVETLSKMQKGEPTWPSH